MKDLLVVSFGLVASAVFVHAPVYAQDNIEGVAMERETLQLPDGSTVIADFGRLAVPENRTAADPATIEIAFVRLHSRADNPGTPLFFLNGGPGDAAVGSARSARSLSRWAPMLAERDVVLFDQRGAGESTPSLRWRADALPDMRVFADREMMLENTRSQVLKAKAALEARGIDLAGYNTIENADDIDALRGTLGYERVALFGFSYGTHLAISYAKRHGDRLGAMILSNVEGPDHTLKLPRDFETQLKRLSIAVANDPIVGKEVPDLHALYLRVREKLDANPMVVTIPGPGGEGEFDIPVGSLFLDYIIRRDIGDASDLPVFPRLLHSIDRGDSSVLRWFVNRRAGIVLGQNGMNAAIDAASGATPGRLEMIADQAARSPFGDLSNFIPAEITALWGVPDLGDEYRAPLVSDVPTLLLSGEWDWNTPPYQAEEIRWGLSNSTHISVGGAGHEQVFTHPDVGAAMLAFLRGEDVSAVRAAWPALKFVPLEGYDSEVTHPSVSRP